MIIDIATDGGFGGIAAAAMHKRINPQEQAQALRDALCAAFAPKALQQMTQGRSHDCPDGLRYRITIIQSGQDPCIFTLSEAQMPPEMLDLIDSV